MNRDQYGIIGQIQADGSIEGGDSACWMGHYIYLTNDKFPYSDTFEVSFGGYVRHPHPDQTNNRFGAYYKNPWNGCISRDQFTGILAGLIKQKDYKALIRVGLHWALSGFLFTYNTVINGKDPEQTKFNLIKFFYNPNHENYYKMPDPTLFNMWGMYLRGFGVVSWLFFPLLCVLDLHLLVDALYTNKDNSDDQINHTTRMMVAQEYVPTPISKLAWKIMDKNHILDRLTEYWCGWRDNCEFVELYRKKIEEIDG